MKKVLLRGPFLTKSGYGVHARQIAKWVLGRPDVDVKVMPLPWGQTPWIIDRNECDGLIGKLMDRCIPAEGRSDVTIQVQLPNEWDPNLGVYNVGVTAGVETDRCNPAWVGACNNMTSIIVPSKFVANTFQASGVLLKPIHVIGESYNDAIDADVNVVNLPRFSTDFNFLVFGQITGNNPDNDRKNIFNTVKYLCEAFKDDPSVGVILKINVGRDTVIDRHNVKELVTRLAFEVRKGVNPRLHILHGHLSDAENAALFKHDQIKCLVTLTRGEGFGLPILDAARSGLPIIATNWSGHLDFLNLGKFIPVSYNLIPVHKSRVDNNIFMSGVRWAEASEVDFKKRVKKFREAPELPQKWATDLALAVKEKFSSEALSVEYERVLGNVL